MTHATILPTLGAITSHGDFQVVRHQCYVNSTIKPINKSCLPTNWTECHGVIQVATLLRLGEVIQGHKKPDFPIVCQFDFILLVSDYFSAAVQDKFELAKCRRARAGKDFVLDVVHLKYHEYLQGHPGY